MTVWTHYKDNMWALREQKSPAVLYLWNVFPSACLIGLQTVSERPMKHKENMERENWTELCREQFKIFVLILFSVPVTYTNTVLYSKTVIMNEFK